MHQKPGAAPPSQEQKKEDGDLKNFYLKAAIDKESIKTVSDS